MPRGRRSPLRVLVVDDDAFAEIVRAIVDVDADFEVSGRAPNGLEGVEMARALRPDVVLMDLDMPLLGGIDATRQIVAERLAATVVVLSGSDAPADIREVRGAGAQAFVDKRRAPEDLLAVLPRDPRCGHLLRGRLTAIGEGRRRRFDRWRAGTSHLSNDRGSHMRKLVIASLLALATAGGASASSLEPNPGSPQAASSANCIAIFSSR